MDTAGKFICMNINNLVILQITESAVKKCTQCLTHPAIMIVSKKNVGLQDSNQ